MKCPRCSHKVDAGEGWCAQCGFNQDSVDEQFGADAVFVERVTDAAGVLPEESRRRIELVLAEFERRFPQLFLMVYVGSLPRQTSLRQFAFWLMNRAAVSDVEITRPNENGVLLMIDAANHAAALTCGYFLECFIGPEDFSVWLDRCSSHLEAGEIDATVEVLAREITACLRKRAAEAAREPARFTAPVPPARVTAPVFTRVHKPAATTEPHRHD